MRDLTVSLVQTTLQWESSVDNWRHFEQQLEGISTTAFSARALQVWREQFPADLDSDVFELKL
jgi:hypothetical protein